MISSIVDYNCHFAGQKDRLAKKFAKQANEKVHGFTK